MGFGLIIGSFGPKHVAEFLILITVYIVVLLTGTNYFITVMHSGMAGIKNWNGVRF